MISIYFTYSDQQFSDFQAKKIIKNLPESLIANSQRFLRWQDKQANLLGKYLLMKGLAYEGYDKSILHKLEYSKTNRPFIDLPLDFNISHSGNFILCAITGKGNVGIDIEEIKEIEFGLFNKIMSREEWIEINRSENKLACFYKFWTLKESVIKADGRGLGVPLTSLKIKDNRVILENKEWIVKKLDFHSDYSSHLSFDTEQEVILKEVTL